MFNPASLCETYSIENSSQIDKISYSPETKIMIVKFKTGGLYLYDDVPVSKVTAMRESESKGSYFSKNIKNLYKCVNLNYIPEWYSI